MLYQHQEKFVKENHKRHLMAWSCGSGKSLAALHSTLGKGRTLIVCPKSLVENWHNEVKKSKLSGEYEVISKEQFKKHCKAIKAPHNLIIDEAHFFSGFKSQLFKTMLWFTKVHELERIYLLTATPYLSTPFNIMCYGQLLGKNWNWRDFRYSFFQDIRMGSRVVPVVKKNIEPQIADLVAGLGTTYKLEELFDVPEQIYQCEYFDINSKQKTAIKEITDFLPIVRFTKIHQIESGTLKKVYGPHDEFDCEKTERVIKLCGEHKKIAIIARYNHQLSLYNRLLVEAYPGRDIYTITGKNHHRNDDIQLINQSEDAIVLINSACSEGFNLWSVPIMVFASLDFSFKNTEQMKGRILRANHLKKNLYIFLITSGDSVDKGVYESYLRKQDFDVEIFAKKNERKKLPNKVH